MILTDEEVGMLSVFPGLTHIHTLVLVDHIRAVESALLAKLRGGVEVPKQAVKLYDVLGQTVEVHGYTLPQLLAYGDARALAAREQDKADAERYRWLTAQPNGGFFHPAFAASSLVRWKNKAEFDPAIDAAIAKESK